MNQHQHTLSSEELSLFQRLRQLLDRERKVIALGRLEELDVIGRRKQRLATAIDRISGRAAATGMARPEILALLRELAVMQAENQKMLEAHQIAVARELKVIRDYRRVSKRYHPPAQHRSVFIDDTK
jgi:hypothetical protein